MEVESGKEEHTNPSELFSKWKGKEVIFLKKTLYQTLM